MKTAEARRRGETKKAGGPDAWIEVWSRVPAPRLRRAALRLWRRYPAEFIEACRQLGRWPRQVVDLCGRTSLYPVLDGAYEDWTLWFFGFVRQYVHLRREASSRFDRPGVSP
jgi:hypothetical protein